MIGATPVPEHITFTVAELAGSVVTGIGGGRILSSEVEKKALIRTKDALANALLSK